MMMVIMMVMIRMMAMIITTTISLRTTDRTAHDGMDRSLLQIYNLDGRCFKCLSLPESDRGKVEINRDSERAIEETCYFRPRAVCLSRNQLGETKRKVAWPAKAEPTEAERSVAAMLTPAV